MKKIVFILALWVFATPILAQTSSITDFGALGDGRTLNTTSIQKAIDHVAAKGGGKVIVPPGEFMTGTIVLKSNIHLYLENGAVLRGSASLDDYLRYSNGTQLGVIFAQEAENIAISGFGTIDGNGRAFVYHDRVKDLHPDLKRSTRQGLAYLDTLKGIQDGPVVPFEHKRPYQMVLMSGIKNVTISDVTIMDSPFWAVHVADSDGVIVKGVRVRNSLLMPNADGLNFTSSSNIVVSDCDIIAGDDALAFSGYSVHHELPGYRDIRRTSENVTVSNCILQTRSAGIRVGGIDQNSLKNYRFDSITIYDSNRGIGIFVHQDGSIEDVHFSNMTIQTRLHTGDWWGNGEPIHISVIEGAPLEKKLGQLKNVSFTNIQAQSENGIIVYGDEPGSIQNLRFRNVTLHMKNGRLQDEYGGNFDLRPTVELEKNIFKHDIPAVYLRHVYDTDFRDLKVTWEESMHSNFKHTIWAEHFQYLNFFGIDVAPPRATDHVFRLSDGDFFHADQSLIRSAKEEVVTRDRVQRFSMSNIRTR
jgi:hypothetical protein